MDIDMELEAVFVADVNGRTRVMPLGEECGGGGDYEGLDFGNGGSALDSMALGVGWNVDGNGKTRLVPGGGDYEGSDSAHRGSSSDYMASAVGRDVDGNGKTRLLPLVKESDSYEGSDSANRGSSFESMASAVARDVDGDGKTRFLPLVQESGGGGGDYEGSDSANRGSSSDSMALAVARDGNLLALMYEFHCEFRSVLNGAVMGEICFPGGELGSKISGGMFLDHVGSDNVEGSPRSFALWCSDGSATVYIISVLDSLVKFEPVCEVPAVLLRSGGESVFHFCQLNESLVRVESTSFSMGGLLIWKPLITVWSIGEAGMSRESESGKCSLSMLLGEGGLSGIHLYPTRNVDERLKEGHQNEILDSNLGILDSRRTGNGINSENRIISCSMVFPDELYYPRYAIVYGFYNGEIEVMRIQSPSLNANSTKEDSLRHSNLNASRCFFTGHTGAVLCLAVHRMDASSRNLRVHRMLLSGSMDCTVRIWDLDSVCLLLVMHHHIDPVKQIILPPTLTERPWNDCFLSVGEDGCVALVSLETLRVERMFCGHPSYPSAVAWDGRRGYLACLCRSMSAIYDNVSILYLWDVETGARERIIRGSASHSMFDHFCSSIDQSISGDATSSSPLIFPIVNDSGFSQSKQTTTDVGAASASSGDMLKSHKNDTNSVESFSYFTNSNKGKLPSLSVTNDADSDSVVNNATKHTGFQHVGQSKKHPVICSCPFPGIVSLEFDLSTLVSLQHPQDSDDQMVSQHCEHAEEQSLHNEPSKDNNFATEGLEGYFLRFSLCFLHLWDIDLELDKLLKEKMDVYKPNGFEISAGIMGDRGSMTLMFPGQFASLELWKSSSEYCAMRSLLIVSLAQRMIGLYHSTTVASSSLAAFYTRNFAEKVRDLKPPSLELLVSFWQDPSEHVRMAARSLFHCAAPRAIPRPLYGQNTSRPGTTHSSVNVEESIRSEIISWFDSFDIHEWVSWIGGTSQDSMAARIIVAAALVVWYPSKVKSELAELVANRLVKLVMSMNDRFSSMAAEILAEGMEDSWKSCLGPEISHLVGDVLFQIECLSGTPIDSVKYSSLMTTTIRDSLVGILLPSLACADIVGFLHVIVDQIWSTSSDSPVHLVSLKTLARIARNSPKALALYLDKVVNYVLQTMDPSNLVMRKACLTSSLLTLNEIARALPMVALNDSTTRLAIGDAIGDIDAVTIRVYDVESVTKVKILDASSPLGLPNLLERTSNTKMATAISALSFSPDGEGLVAFSENGLMLRWWSLGTNWWEKLSRSLVPVQCTKLIFIPPWEGFSPNSSRSSIMANIAEKDRQVESESTQEQSKESNEADRIRLLLHNLDLSYRLRWIAGRNVLLTRHGQALGTYPM